METALFDARISIAGTQAAIPTLTSTPTLTPSQTPTATPTFTSKQIYYGTSDAFFATSKAGKYATQTSTNATLEARNVKCKDGFVIEQYSDILIYSNDKWTLFTCSPISSNKSDEWTPGIVDYGTRYTQIIKNDLSKTWTIQHDTFDYSIIDRPDALMSPVRWTADGKYLYLHPLYYPGASGFPRSYFLYADTNNLYRINLETGEFNLFLKSDQYNDFAFSPDDKFLIYSDYEKPDMIHLRNLETNDDLQIDLNENIVAAGAFIWDAKSTEVVFFTGYSKQSDDWQDDLSGTAIFVLTLQNVHVQKVLTRDSRLFAPNYECSDNTYWLDKNTICIQSMSDESDIWNKIFTFNIQTGAVKFLRYFP